MSLKLEHSPICPRKPQSDWEWLGASPRGPSQPQHLTTVRTLGQLCQRYRQSVPRPSRVALRMFLQQQKIEHIIRYLGGQLLPVAVAYQLVKLLREVAESMQFQDRLISGSRAIQADLLPNPLACARLASSGPVMMNPPPDISKFSR
jgi:hypothetical protein